MRSVHHDMVDLFEPLLEIEGRHASQQELESAHHPDYLEQVRTWSSEAAMAGRPMVIAPGLVASAATWDASSAAVGCALVGIEAIADGAVRNAFAATRPPGRDASAEAPGTFGFLNPVSVSIEFVLERQIASRVLLVEWGDSPPTATARIEAVRRVALAEPPKNADGQWFLSILGESLVTAMEGFAPEFVVLSAGFEWVGGDPVGGRAILPENFHEATRLVRNLAEEHCEGRLLSILEGGYDGRALGSCVVQHLRALIGLPAR